MDLKYARLRLSLREEPIDPISLPLQQTTASTSTFASVDLLEPLQPWGANQTDGRLVPGPKSWSFVPFSDSRSMTTIPARLAQVARTSASPEEAAARARTLYRTWYRGVSSRTFQPFAGESPSRDQ